MAELFPSQDEVLFEFKPAFKLEYEENTELPTEADLISIIDHLQDKDPNGYWYDVYVAYEAALDGGVNKYDALSIAFAALDRVA